LCFYIARHGETNEDLEDHDMVSGWNDVPLNAQGRLNASRAARRLSDLGITSILSSDTPRAQQTAQIIGRYLDMPVVESPRLRSWNMGALTGMEREVARPFLCFFEKNPDIKVPKGEAFRTFYNRFKAVFEHFVGHVRKFPDSHPLLITHSQDLGILQWIIDNVGPGRVLEGQMHLQPGGILEVRVDEGVILRKLKV
jgi:broad specificity phosphatase PhoE